MTNARRLVGGGLRATVRRRGSRVHLSDPAVCQDPFSLYEALRRTGPVQFLPADRSWIVLGYDEVVSVLSRPQVFSSSPLTVFDPLLLGADPPDHTAIRRALARELAKTLPQVANETGETATRLLESLAARDEFDAISDFARPLSDSVAARILGFDAAAADRIRSVAGEGPQDLAFGNEAIVPTIAAILGEAGGSARWESVLAASGVERSARLAPFLRLLWIAASRTTRQTLAASILVLLRHPEVRQWITANDDALPFVEEVVRLEPAEHFATRMARTEVVLSGVRIPAHATLKLCLAAANRDPLRFDNPESLIPQRAPNPHLGFGAGPHRCPGARLARVETMTALRALLTVMPQFRTTRPLSTVRYLGWPGSRALEALVIRSR
jgi:cytochrome P450